MNLSVIARALIRDGINTAGVEIEAAELDKVTDAVIASLSDAGLLVEPKAPGRVGRPPKAETAAK